jgi:hypothetical protein
MRQLFTSPSFTGNTQIERALTIAQIFCVLLSIETANELLLRHLNIVDCLWVAPCNAALYTLIFIGIFRLDLHRLSISYLALPYFIFFPGWLNTPTAILISCVFLYCLYKTLQHKVPATKSATGIHELTAFILILVWVNLSGAGGYGYQTFDYAVHNARLLDLVRHEWPVHYGKDQNFVYYFAYFLPSALLGKLFGTHIAIRSMYPWTVVGVCIAFRWLSINSQWRPSALLAAIFILFGPLDIIGLTYLYLTTDGMTPAFAWKVISDNTDTVDFWNNPHASFFIGNFVSNTFQLFWSPPQIIAGWICAGMLMYSFEKGNLKQAGFVFSLLSLWAPLVMIGIFPVVAGAMLLQGRGRWRNNFTLDNTAGAGIIILLFLIFYASGSMQKNDSFWLFSAKNRLELFILFFSAWGLYGIAIMKNLRLLNREEKILAALLTTAVLALMTKSYGAYNDLLCRASAPLMFITLTLLLRISRQNPAGINTARRVFIFALIAPGCFSALLQINTAITDYGHMEPAANIVRLAAIPNPNLGSDDNLFRHYLARKTTPK